MSETNRFEEAHMPLPGDFISRKQLAAFLGISLSTVDRLLKNREIPHLKIRGMILFEKAKLSEWLNKHEVNAENIGS